MTSANTAAEAFMEQACTELSIEPARWNAGAVEALGVLLTAFDERPSKAGIAEIAFSGNVVRRLKNLICLSRLAPGIEPHPSRRTMAIVGLPRTGSTLLHNLLALESGTSFIKHWDVNHSWWRTGPSTVEDARAEVQVRLDLMDAIGAAIRDTHPMSLDWPEECTVVFENSFASFQWPITYGLPTYFDWLRAVDLTTHYEVYRQALAHLIEPTASRVVLKSPFHVLDLASLDDAVPNLTLVQTVRDPEDVIASWFQLLNATHGAMYDGVLLPDSMRSRWIELLGEMAHASTNAADRSIVVHYNQLVKDPVGVVRGILATEGRELDAAHERRMREWMGSAEARRRGAHYGRLPPEVLTNVDRERFGAYAERFATEQIAE